MSQSVIAALRVNLELSTAAFQKSMKAIQGKLGNFSAKFGSSLGKLAEIGKKAFQALAVVASAAFAAIGLGVTQAAKNAGQIEQMSAAFGISVENYQAMSGAASKFGIEQEKLNDIWKDSNEKIGEYISLGSGGFKDFMDMVGNKQGVKAEDLIKLPPEQRFQTMIAMMEKQGLTAEQMSFALESMASDATYLIPLFQNGGKEFEKIKNHMIETGQIMSDKVVSELASTARNASQIGGIFKGWGNLLVSGFSNQLDQITFKLSNLLGGSENVRAFFVSAGQSIGNAMDWASSAISSLIIWFQQMNSEGGKINSIGNSMRQVWESIGPAVIAFGKAMWEGIKLAVDVMLTFADVSWKALASITEYVGPVIELLANGLVGAIKSVQDWFASVPQGVSDAFGLVVAYGSGAVEAIVQAFGALPNALGDLMIQAANFVIKALAGMVDKAINTMKAGIDLLPESVTSTFGWKMQTSDLASTAGVNNPYEGAASNLGKNFGETFGEAARNEIERQNIRDALKIDPITVGVITDVLPPNGPTNPPPTTAPRTLQPQNINTGGAGGGDAGGKKGKERLTDLQKTMKKLNDELAQYKENVASSALQEAIWQAQRDAGVLGSSEQGKRIAAIVTETEKLKSQKSAVEALGDSFKGMFASVITGSENASSVLSSFFKTIQNNLANKAVASLWDGLLGASGGSSGWLGGLASSLGFGDIPARANGGSLSAGLAMVGERGPELISVGTSARVSSAPTTKRLLSGAAGGVTKVEIGISSDVEARIINQSSQNAVKITKDGIGQYDKNINSRFRQFNSDPYKK